MTFCTGMAITLRVPGEVSLLPMTKPNGRFSTPTKEFPWAELEKDKIHIRVIRKEEFVTVTLKPLEDDIPYPRLVSAVAAVLHDIAALELDLL